ncbi:MAG: hypothetical protein JXA68_07775 [Ignavibacteriales bacterium]|nr:hypothetical protein [Ignavibacteriales bacterium]
MKKINLLFVFLFSILFSSCDLIVPEDFEKISYQQIEMKCMDLVSIGDKLQTIIFSQSDYYNLIYQRFTKPLQDYWTRALQCTIENIRNMYPNLTEQEILNKAIDIIYSYAPFYGTKDCEHPTIDFNRYTLLGQSAHSGGCKRPDYKIEFRKSNFKNEYIFKITITRYGSCEMGVLKKIWILVPKIPKGSIVRFETEEFVGKYDYE